MGCGTAVSNGNHTSNGIYLWGIFTEAVSRVQTSIGKQAKLMTEALQLPVIDLSSPDRLSTAKLIRQVIIVFRLFLIALQRLDNVLFNIFRHV